MNIEKYQRYNEIAKQAFKGNGNEKVSAAYSMNGVKNDIFDAVIRARASRKECEEHLAKNKEDYKPHKAQEMYESELNAHKAIVDAYRQTLIADLEKTVENQRLKLYQYATKMPTDEQMRMLDIIKLKDGKLTDLEMGYYIKALGDNYQALTTLQTVTNGEFELPLNIDNLDESLNYSTKLLEQVINHIDDEQWLDKSLAFNEMATYDPNSEYADKGIICPILNYIDRETPFDVVEDSPTLLQTINKAIETYRADNNLLNVVKLEHIKQTNMDIIETDADREREINERLDKVYSDVSEIITSQ